MKSHLSHRKTITALAATLFSTLSWAALPTGTLEFITPNATVGATDQIDVWMRFTLDPNSSPLVFSTDPNTGLLTGFDAADLPTQGTYYDADLGKTVSADFAKVTGAALNTVFWCDDTFTGGCNNGTKNYSFNFFTASQTGKPSLNFVDHFNLTPGQSTEYVFGQFNPAPGGAAPGTYQLFGSGLFLYFTGFDAAGHSLYFDNYTGSDGSPSTLLARTCATGNSNECAFTRTVNAVPEPSTYLLMAMGIAAIGMLKRRREGKEEQAA